MKKALQAFSVLFLILLVFTSCRDEKAKAQEAEMIKAEVEKIDAIEHDIEDTKKRIEAKADEAVEALSELDSL